MIGVGLLAALNCQTRSAELIGACFSGISGGRSTEILLVHFGLWQEAEIDEKFGDVFALGLDVSRADG